MHTSDPTEIQGSPLKFHPVDEHWQQTVCDIMGLHFHGKNRVRPGGPNIPLTHPDMRTVKKFKGDGNCLFRALAYIITGSEEQHMAVRRAILQHMIHISSLVIMLLSIPLFKNTLQIRTWTRSMHGVLTLKCLY